MLLWSNNNLLFWMSLIPFVTAYLGQNCHAPLAVAAYGAVFVLVSAAFLLLQMALAQQERKDTVRQQHFRRLNKKAVFSMAAVGLAFVNVNVSFAIFGIIPLLYFWPEHKSAHPV